MASDPPSLTDSGLRDWVVHKPTCFKNRTTTCVCDHDAAQHESYRNPLDHCNGDGNNCGCHKFVQNKSAGICTCGLDAALLLLRERIEPQTEEEIQSRGDVKC